MSTQFDCWVNSDFRSNKFAAAHGQAFPSSFGGGANIASVGNRIEESGAKVAEVRRGWLGDDELTESVEGGYQEALTGDALERAGDGINENGEPACGRTVANADDRIRLRGRESVCEVGSQISRASPKPKLATWPLRRVTERAPQQLIAERECQLA